MTMSGASSTAFSRASAASPAVEISASGVSACLSIPRIMGLSSPSRSFTLLGIVLLNFAAAVVAALAARFAFQFQVADFDALIQRLAHVVDRQRRDPGRDQCFHLDSGLGGGLHLWGHRHPLFRHAQRANKVRKGW